MRTIVKRPAPTSLTQWRAPRLGANRPDGMECTYEEMRRTPGVLNAVEDGLFAEQGGLCAYTGHRIARMPAESVMGVQRAVDFHIEHLKPQAHCAYGEDAEYANLVACWPRPDCGFEPAYGARKKGAWPSVAEQAQFVSPLRADCSARFTFSWRGEISAAMSNDTAADDTILRLGLKDRTLAAYRREAIRGALNPATHPIRLAQARKLLEQMRRDSGDLNQGASIRLMPFCFAVQQALEREIRKLEAIRNRP